MTRSFCAGALLALLASGAPAADPPDPAPAKVSFTRDVLPLFQQHCVGCHQPAKQGGSYLMTSRADLLKKGDTDNPGVVPGKPEQSYLLAQLRPADGKPPAMPKNKPPLSEKEVGLIARWIAEGAVDDTVAATTPLVDASHPPVYELPPVVTSLDYSPDGSLLAVSGYHEVLLYKADGSALVGRLVGMSEQIQSLKFSP